VEGADPGSPELSADELSGEDRPYWAEDEPPDDDEPVEEPAPVAGAEPEPLPQPGPVAEPVAETEAMVGIEPVADSSGLALPVALGLVLVVLLAAVGWLVTDTRDTRARDDARQAALQAARQEAVNLTTISYVSADADLGRIIAAATGTLKTQFEAQRAQFPAVLTRDKSVSVGNVLAAGVASQSSSTVEALVAVDAAVSNGQTAKASARPLVKHYRMDMKLVLVGGRWLVSQVAFAGLPQ
jgi:Mce-associated membrane protein